MPFVFPFFLLPSQCRGRPSLPGQVIGRHVRATSASFVFPFILLPSQWGLGWGCGVIQIIPELYVPGARCS